ncbi:unnamed protein product [Clonostachys byssicola]|uniref:Zn(2)-C6 fungal-type domain-containing protein n=1 Tax=Clonostachys byssicola TaxID=160290 RepID=A0A9N9UF23_9HYPO|nr:unnamed protein product [Clonostachys byssicola]
MKTSAGPATSGMPQRAAVACQNCRLRKVKCDAQYVTQGEGCSPCRRARQNCFFDPMSDGRRSVSHKFVHKLQRRIETLEALNQGTSNQSSARPAPSNDVTATSADNFTSIPLENSSEALPTSLPRATIPSITSPQNIDPPSHFVQSPGPVEIHQVPSSPVQQKQDSPRCRRSSISRFYGASSQPHVSFPNDESLLVLANEAKNDPGYIDLDPNSCHLRDSLLQEFFKYQILLVELVDEDLFSRHRNEDGNESRWYSEFLENIILACSSRLSTSESVRRLGLNYYELAKEGVSKALYEPSPANLQGFLLLSEYESTIGQSSLGWMYCGKFQYILP